MQFEHELPKDYQNLWIQTMMFKASNCFIITVSTPIYEKNYITLLSYQLKHGNIKQPYVDYILKYNTATCVYEINGNRFAKYNDELNYMWSTISK